MGAARPLRRPCASSSSTRPSFCRLSSRESSSWKRNLIVLAGYGALTLARYQVQEELELLQELPEEHRVGGAPLERLLAGIDFRRSELSELLPVRTPDDLCLVGSRLLFDEVERKVTEIGHRFDPALADNTAARVRRQLENLSSGYLVEFQAAEGCSRPTRAIRMMTTWSR